MPDTGSPWNIPYVENADLVRDWPADSLLVANAVAAGLSAAGNAGIGSNVVQTVKTDTFSTASATFVTVTGLTATITPTLATSKILIIAQVSYSCADSFTSMTYKVTRGGTDIYRGDADSGRTQGVFGGQTTASTGNLVPSGSIVFLDSPGVATATTYQVEMASTTGTSFVNRGRAPSATTAYTNAASSITVIEVAA